MRAFLPHALPPADPELAPESYTAGVRSADMALARLSGVAGLVVSNGDDVEEVSNYLRAFNLVRENLHSPNGFPISVRLLCDAHRLLIAALMEHWGVLPEPLMYLSGYLKQHQSLYYQRLSAVRTNGDWEAWVTFFLEGVAVAATDAERGVVAVASLVAADRKRVLAAPRVGAISLRLFELLPLMPRFTIEQVRQKQARSFPTATAAVKPLEELGIVVERTGQKKNRRRRRHGGALTEDQLEQEALGWLADVGYTVARGPELAPDGKAPERASYRQMLQANRRFHCLLVGGVPVQYQKDGETRGDFVHLVDWAQPGRNEWLAANQFSIQGPKHTRRPDVILFVNGLPLVPLELKNPADVHADVWKAYDQIQTYKEQIADAFHFNELQTLVRGVLAPAYLLDYLRYFVLFEDDDTLVKKIAGYRQSHAVRAAIAQVVRLRGPMVSPASAARAGWCGTPGAAASASP